MQNLTIYIIANASMGTGMSGSDRIFIECARRWARDGCQVNVVVWEEGYQLCHKNKLDNVNYIVWPTSRYKRLGFALFYLVRVIKGSLFILRIKPIPEDRAVIYSASDFWMDSIPAWIMRICNRSAKWIAGFYLFMPSPWNRDFPYKGKKIVIGLLYWITQKPIYYLIKRYADMVFVTTESYINRFITQRRSKDKIISIHGGIDTGIVKSVSEPKEKIYDAVFLGRFHPQKGVLELIDIWKYVCDNRKGSVLAIIGEGDLEVEMRERIEQYNLTNNIRIFGFTDGVEKVRIFKNSRIALYPATLDHWSMAPVEAMICGLPLVTFDMPVVKVINLRGAICVPCYDLKGFANEIVNLLENTQLYSSMRKEAIEWARRWDWDSKAKDILNTIECLWEARLS